MGFLKDNTASMEENKNEMLCKQNRIPTTCYTLINDKHS